MKSPTLQSETKIVLRTLKLLFVIRRKKMYSIRSEKKSLYPDFFADI
jgi:hypothetical protein